MKESATNRFSFENYKNLNIAERQELFYDYIIEIECLTESTAKAYSRTSVNSEEIIKIIKNNSGYGSMYFITNPKYINDIILQSSKLSKDIKGNKYYSSAFKKYQKFLLYILKSKQYD